MDKKLVDVLVERGHFPAISTWDDPEEVTGHDAFGMSEEYCNGPRCAFCHEDWCEHCLNDYEQVSYCKAKYVCEEL